MTRILRSSKRSWRWTIKSARTSRRRWVIPALIRQLLTNRECRSSLVRSIISLAKPLSTMLWRKTTTTLMSWMTRTRTASSMTRYDRPTGRHHCGSSLSRILIRRSSCRDVAVLQRVVAAALLILSIPKSASSSRRTFHLTLCHISHFPKIFLSLHG